MEAAEDSMLRREANTETRLIGRGLTRVVGRGRPVVPSYAKAAAFLLLGLFILATPGKAAELSLASADLPATAQAGNPTVAAGQVPGGATLRASAPTGDPGTVTLGSLLDAAMRDSPRIRAAGAAYAAAKERVSPAGALPDPMLMFTAEGTPLTTPSPTNAATGKIALTQMFPFPGKQGLMRSSMAEEAAMGRSQLDRTRLEVASDLHAAFFELDRIYQSIDLLEQTHTTMRMFADIARTRYETGSAQQMDMLKATVELAQESNKLATLRTQLPAAVARVNSILGRAPDAPLGRPVLPDTTAIEAAGVLEQRAVELQPMLKMKANGVRKSEFDLRLARREGLPDFTLGVEYMSEKEMPDSWTGMAGLTLPIWRGNKVGPNRRGAEQTLASAQAERAQTEAEVRFMVREAYAMVSSARAMSHLYRDSILPQAEASLASSKAAYETNRAGFLDLLEAQRMLLDSRMGYLDATADYLKGRAALGLAVGDPEMLGVKYE
jgi:outer membrane protein, heavy metal efflux system